MWRPVQAVHKSVLMRECDHWFGITLETLETVPVSFNEFLVWSAYNGEGYQECLEHP